MARDYLDGDHSFKRWFKIMWKNSYIIIFTVAIIALGYQLFNFNMIMDLIVENFSYSTMGGIMTTIGMLIPISVASVTAYLGFYRFWRELTGKEDKN